MTITPASLGSISHGTLRSEDLVEAFWSELEYQLHHHTESAERDAAAAYTLLGRLQDELWDEDGNLVDDPEALDEAINDLQDALQSFAPPYCYFGAHCGDGSDFGYWPETESIDDLPKYDDLASVPDDNTEDFAIVNDHGNVAVYSAAGVLLVYYV